MDQDSEGASSTGATDAADDDPPPGGTDTPPDPGTGSGGNDDAATTTGGADGVDDTTDGGEDDTTTGEPPPGDACQPDPTRMVILGDSIVACAGVAEGDCISRLVNDHLAQQFPDITYENLSVGGAVTRNVAESQIHNIEVGQPGHVVVMIYIGGNDLAAYIFQPDAAAVNGWKNTTGPEVAAAWEEILDFLGDEANFPDGVTLLMNTQYNPFDDCTAPPYFVSETKIELLHAHNDALTARADSRPWAFIADQHPVYLGHGHYVNDSGCPYYDETYEGWMNDLIHPNEPGHNGLATVMNAMVDDQVYGGCE